jgi:hypothetical protein
VYFNKVRKIINHPS